MIISFLKDLLLIWPPLALPILVTILHAFLAIGGYYQ